MEEDENNLFVKHLPNEFKDEDLEKLFSKFGKITSCKVMINEKKESLGYGFVLFQDKKEAMKAKNQMHGYKIGKKTLICKFSNVTKQSKCLVLKNVPPKTKLEDIKQIFNDYGLLNIKNYKDSIYLLFKDEDTCLQLYKKYNGNFTLEKKPILLKFGKERVFKMKEEQPITNIFEFQNLDQKSGANLYVFHLPEEFDDIKLFNLFSNFGKIESVKVILDPITKESKGYGFVKFYNLSDAINAISNLNGFKIGRKNLKVSFKK